MKNEESKLFNELIKNIKITYNPELDKDEDVISFPDKLKKGRETIARIGMPKAYYEQMAKQNEEKKE